MDVGAIRASCIGMESQIVVTSAATQWNRCDARAPGCDRGWARMDADEGEGKE
jgi:hypothetical protein